MVFVDMNFHPIENSSDTAEIIVPILLDWYNPGSVLDLGCNTGWWLHWFINHGVTDVIGIDGTNMLADLKIPGESFICGDLTKPLALNRKFDLVLCLEVAEHLHEEHADHLVKIVTDHSDTIFWSAAVPGQGGWKHINEQPHEYWIEKFEKAGYSARELKDILPNMPHDYYRKNAIEFIKL